jgi:hypothetical protein
MTTATWALDAPLPALSSTTALANTKKATR